MAILVFIYIYGLESTVQEAICGSKKGSQKDNQSFKGMQGQGLNKKIELVKLFEMKKAEMKLD